MEAPKQAPEQEHSIEGRCPDCGDMIPLDGENKITKHSGCETSGVDVADEELDIMSA